MMAKSAQEIIDSLPKRRRDEISKRGEELIAEELALRELRKAMKLTQEAVAKELEIGQDAVSRLENRTDLMLSTLRKYVEALGGRLQIYAEFPQRPPVALSGFSDARDAQKP